MLLKTLLRWLSGKALACNAGDVGLTPGLGRSPGERNGNPLQHSCLENPRDRGAWWGCKELDTTEQLSTHLSVWYVGCLLTGLRSLYSLVHLPS